MALPTAGGTGEGRAPAAAPSKLLGVASFWPSIAPGGDPSKVEVAWGTRASAQLGGCPLVVRQRHHLAAIDLLIVQDVLQTGGQRAGLA